MSPLPKESSSGMAAWYMYIARAVKNNRQSGFFRGRVGVSSLTVVDYRPPVLRHLSPRPLALAAIPSRQLLTAPPLRAAGGAFAVVGALRSAGALRLLGGAAVSVTAGSELQCHGASSDSGAACGTAVNGSH
jgi:hypothetical protein